MIPNKSKASPRILVIDDNIAIHEDFRKILMKTAKPVDDLQGMRSALFGSETQTLTTIAFEIDCASQGKEGLAMAQQAAICGASLCLGFCGQSHAPRLGWH